LHVVTRIFHLLSDVARAKFLNRVVEIGRDNKLIDDAGESKVFDAFCQLSDEKTVDDEQEK